MANNIKVPRKYKAPNRRRGFNRNENTLTPQDVASNALSSFSTIFTLRPQAKYVTGARTILRINGSPVAFAFQISWNVRTDATEIYTIDDPLPWEIAPKQIEVTGTLGLLQIPGQSPNAMNYQADIGAFLMNRYISIEVKDATTDAILFKAGSAMIVGQQGEINSEQIGRTTLTWRAIGWQAENPSTPLKPEANDNSNPNGNTLNKTASWIKSKF
jgi:hypothetical protein